MKFITNKIYPENRYPAPVLNKSVNYAQFDAERQLRLEQLYGDSLRRNWSGMLTVVAKFSAPQMSLKI